MGQITRIGGDLADIDRAVRRMDAAAAEDDQGYARALRWCSSQAAATDFEHGTAAGHGSHRRRREPSCAPCRAAYSTYTSEKAKARRALRRAS